MSEMVKQLRPRPGTETARCMRVPQKGKIITSRRSVGEKVQARSEDRFDRELALVSRHSGVPVSLLLHHSRCRVRIARARQLAMYLMNTSLSRSMTDIGSYFGRDRTTVAYACGRIEDWRDDRDFDDEVAALEAAISASVENAGKAVRADA